MTWLIKHHELFIACPDMTQNTMNGRMGGSMVSGVESFEVWFDMMMEMMEVVEGEEMVLARRRKQVKRF